MHAAGMQAMKYFKSRFENLKIGRNAACVGSLNKDKVILSKSGSHSKCFMFPIFWFQKIKVALHIWVSSVWICKHAINICIVSKNVYMRGITMDQELCLEALHTKLRTMVK